MWQQLSEGQLSDLFSVRQIHLRVGGQKLGQGLAANSARGAKILDLAARAADDRDRRKLALTRRDGGKQRGSLRANGCRIRGVLYIHAAIDLAAFSNERSSYLVV